MPFAIGRRLGGLFVTLALVAPATAQEDWGATLAAAQQEGSLVIYHSQLGARYFDDVVDMFEEETGIDVKTLDARATEVMERIRAEGNTGNVGGDIVFSSTAILQALQEANLLAEAGPLPNTEALFADAGADAYRVPAWTQVMGILVNTNLVAPEEEPTSWEDVLDPKWKGKIISNEVRTIGGGLGALGPIWKHYGDDYLARLAEQDITMSRDMRLEERRVALGEFAMLTSEILAFYKELDGLPVKIIMPDPGVPYTPIDMSMLAGAHHPNAARVFMNFFIGSEAQAVYGMAGMRPVRDGVIETLPQEDRMLLEKPLLGWLQREDRQDAIATMKRYFGEN
ncbi:MAG: ABC transporter substrate-binding protein [Qingshengfaniella sp.]